MTATSTGAPKGASARSTGETNGKVKSVTIRGQRFTMPHTVTAQILADIDNDDPLGILRAILGDEQMERFFAIELPTGKGLREELRELILEATTKVGKAIGLEPGES